MLTTNKEATSVGFLRRLLARKAQMAIWVFNSNRISDEVTGLYGAYAENQLLHALGQALESHGGWRAQRIVGCHGDLFDADILGNPTGTVMLSEWLKSRCPGIANYLSRDFAETLLADASGAGFVPYAIGVWPVASATAAVVDQKMNSSGVVGYVGYLLVDETARVSSLRDRLASMREVGMTGSDAFFGALASALCLPVKMGVRRGEAFGWLVSDSDLAALGLSRLTH